MCTHKERQFEKMAEESRGFEKNTENINQMNKLWLENYSLRLKIQEYHSLNLLLRRDIEEVYSHMRLLISFMRKDKTCNRMHHEIDRLERQQRQRFSGRYHTQWIGSVAYDYDDDILFKNYNVLEEMEDDNFYGRRPKRLPFHRR